MFGRTPRSFRFFRFLFHLPNFVRLTWRLFWDPRVPIYRKAVLVIFEAFAIAFAGGLFPIPAFRFSSRYFSPILGYTDDLIIGIFLILVPGAWLFIKVAPEDIVQEHVERISQRK